LPKKYLDRGEPDLLERAIGAIVSAAFVRSNANQVHAALHLGISRNALRTRLARLGLIAGRASRSRDASG
jgi:DNA-binding NtrC family response regulator